MIYQFMASMTSVMQGIFLESPAPVVVTLVLAAVVLTFCGINTRRMRLVGVSLGLVAVAFGVIVLSTMVTTQREEVSAATRQLLGATTYPVSIAGIRDKLAPDAKLFGPHGDVWIESKDLLPDLEKALKRWPIKVHYVRDSFIRVNDEDGQGVASVELQISTRTFDTADMDVGHATRWGLVWKRNEQGRWLVHEIRWLQWLGQPPSKGLLR